jgi:uncharacterized protein with FMN-binding domain
MRKFLLSAGVIAFFAIYAFFQRMGGTALAPTAPVAGLPASQPSASTAAGNGNPSGSGASGALPPNQPAQSAQPTATTPSNGSGGYKDGTYTGPVTDAFYGQVQVQATISGGKITDVKFLQYPSDRFTSQMINQQATPILRNEAIQAQSANVNLVSGATLTSSAFVQSLQAALTSAQ